MAPVKLIISWDIVQDREQEYFEFLIREFLPGMQKLGFELSDAWATVFGNEPQILVGAVLPSLEQAEDLLASSDWISLHNRLLDYVENYSQKLVPARGGFQFLRSISMTTTMAGQLLAWYQKNARELPWRFNSDPYAILVSEVMLQQTRVDTVIPYYSRWMDRFQK